MTLLCASVAAAIIILFVFLLRITEKKEMDN